jgi:hypothetical protein
MLMPHKFGANVSNLVLMPKKTGGRDHYNFIFFLNHVLTKTRRTPGEPTGRTPSIFVHKYLSELLLIILMTSSVWKKIY